MPTPKPLICGTPSPKQLRERVEVGVAEAVDLDQRDALALTAEAGRDSSGA